MFYPINEIFYSIQGEGYHVGKPAVFVRFAGCNLKCDFCDTDHSENDRLSEQQIVEYIQTLWTWDKQPFIVLTGGEPTIHNLYPLLKELQKEGMYVALETNGTKELPLDMDWLTISPKTGHRPSHNILEHADEIKVVWEDNDNIETYLDVLSRWYANTGLDKHSQPISVMPLLYLQSCSENFTPAVAFVLRNPNWKLSVQIQKILKMK